MALSTKPWLLLLMPAFLTSMMLGSLTRARKADLVFANWSICGLIAGVVGRVLGRPVVTTLRGEDAARAASSHLYRFLVHSCLCLGNRVVAVSDDIAQTMKAVFPAMADRVLMIPNGVDPMDGDGERRQLAEGGRVRLLVVGSLIPRKSVETALHALAELPAGFSLTVAGDGPEAARLSAIAAELRIGDRVRFVGHVSPEQIPSWLGAADVLVMTSRSEGRPNAVLEAMAAGLPVVGSDIPGLRELVVPGVTGLLFPVGDSSALADRLRALVDGSLRGELGAHGRQQIVDLGLTWENSASRYLQVFDDLLKERAH